MFQEQRLRRAALGSAWCRRRGSNPHARKGRGILSPVRLPIPPLRHCESANRCVVANSSLIPPLESIPVWIDGDTFEWAAFSAGVSGFSGRIGSSDPKDAPVSGCVAAKNLCGWVKDGAFRIETASNAWICASEDRWDAWKPRRLNRSGIFDIICCSRRSYGFSYR
jgi:hypothetical protein